MVILSSSVQVKINASGDVQGDNRKVTGLYTPMSGPSRKHLGPRAIAPDEVISSL
jgi:hypothetical protein